MSALRHLVGYHNSASPGKRWIRRSPIGSSHSKFPAGIYRQQLSLADSFGIPVVPTLLTRNADEATSASERIGFRSFLRSSRPKSPTRATSAEWN